MKIKKKIPQKLSQTLVYLVYLITANPPISNSSVLRHLPLFIQKRLPLALWLLCRSGCPKLVYKITDRPLYLHEMAHHHSLQQHRILCLQSLCFFILSTTLALDYNTELMLSSLPFTATLWLTQQLHLQLIHPAPYGQLSPHHRPLLWLTTRATLLTTSHAVAMQVLAQPQLTTPLTNTLTVYGLEGLNHMISWHVLTQHLVSNTPTPTPRAHNALPSGYLNNVATTPTTADILNASPKHPVLSSPPGLPNPNSPLNNHSSNSPATPSLSHPTTPERTSKTPQALASPHTVCTHFTP